MGMKMKMKKMRKSPPLPHRNPSQSAARSPNLPPPSPMPILIVLLGSGLVIAAIIGLRLPAFLALIGAALIVASITPQDARTRSAARPAAAEVLDGVQYPAVDAHVSEGFDVVPSSKNTRNGPTMLLKAA